MTRPLLAFIMATTLLLSGCASTARVELLEQDMRNAAWVILGLDARVADLEAVAEDEAGPWRAF